ncbi:hypothetical protein AAFF_G00098640 [Aldrovandia affinis]|uniref:Inactive serine protease PAMR1 n=1 Tax=Aldrovandia affinis TaxID=143900 RepID=A0AAD7WCJ5_9TELE|nr:hypothetical protein AAFF_G00098640 [Aldrovandia affinis]
MLSAGCQLLALCGGTRVLRTLSLILLFIIFKVPAWPYDYRLWYDNCPGAEWNIMCRGCCEYDRIRCKCPSQGTLVGYAVPCCRNAINECDPCIIHPGCSIFENCRRCNNGTWGAKDDFFIRGKYCTECRPGWTGGDCMKCGGVIRKPQGHVVLESYPTNARCEWTLQVDRGLTVDLRFMMLSLEFDHSCRYDYVEVRDGDGLRSRVIGRYCGNDRPPPIRSSGNSLHILFVSDGYKNFDGFFAIFQESTACSSSPCLHDGTCILDSTHSYHCACLAGYTGERCENVPRERTCGVLEKPAHGDHFLVYGPDDTLIAVQYLCYRPYTLSGTGQRTCLPNSTWSGIAPSCVKPHEPDTGHEKEKGQDKDTEESLNTVESKDNERSKGTDGSKDTGKGLNTVESIDEEKIKDTINIKDTAKSPDTGGTKDAEKITDTISGGKDTIKVPDTAGSKDTGKSTDTVVPKDTDAVGSNDTGSPTDTTGSKDTGGRVDTVGGQDTGSPTDDKGSRDTGSRVDTVSSTETVSGMDTGQESDTGGDTGTGGEAETDNQSINEADRTRCPPPPKLYNGYHQVVLGSGGDLDRAEFFCNNSYALSGGAVRTCQLNGSWSGKQPLCVRACREPKVSAELVKQQVLPPQVPPRKTPVHKLFSSSLGKLFDLFNPTKAPPSLPQLPLGFHHLYTHIEYECISAFYHHAGSPRRTCLKTGKWSGRHVSCSPVCGKLPDFESEKLAETRWPWHAAIYRRSSAGSAAKLDKMEALAGGLGKTKAKPGEEEEEEEGEAEWQLVCSGALVNQRSVVVAAHCVTELGKLMQIAAANIKVVMGKHYRSDRRETKNQQHLRVSSVLVHPNYDPLVLDSDLAVLKLLDKARIGEHVLPVCLPAKQGGELTERQAYVVGWSILPEPQGGAGAGGEEEMARGGLIELGDVVQCERQYAQQGAPITITDNMLCGRQHPRGLSNICPADTGGIVVLPPSSSSSSAVLLEGQEAGGNVWRLLGVVSHGYEQHNCSPELFTVYTRAANFKDWIEASMK